MQMITRKNFILTTLTGTAGALFLPGMLNGQAQLRPAKGDPLDKALVKEFVTAAHKDFEKMKALLQETPDLLIDMATLTGSARVALGPDLPPFYTNDEKLAGDVTRHSQTQKDPLWRMPFWDPYYSLFESPVAALNNSADTSFAGSITAALFLKRFVENAKSYLHLDIYGWTPTAKPGFPKGGEAEGIRALFSLISERYKK